MGNPRVAYSMRALGKQDVPDTFVLAGRTYGLVRTIKHDFFAATALYVDEGGRRAVLKVGRVAEFAALPLQWAGVFLCRRELQLYRKLAGLPQVPRVLGTWGPTGFVLEYVEGRPISERPPIPDGFFDELEALFAEMHRRGIAYVDANKPQNILLGDDGRPHLVDFQISWLLDRLGDWWLNRWVLRRLQCDDRYHLLKHKRRLRPDELTPAELERLAKKSLLLRMHRFLSKPYFNLRRRTFQRLRQSGRLLPEGSK